MVIVWRDEYEIGTVVRLFKNGVEGIVISELVKDGLDQPCYLVETSIGETIRAEVEMMAERDHPVHALLEQWNDEALRINAETVAVGIDREGTWHPLYFSGSSQWDKVSASNSCMNIKYFIKPSAIERSVTLIYRPHWLKD
jgi:hypothetical protein